MAPKGKPRNKAKKPKAANSTSQTRPPPPPSKTPLPPPNEIKARFQVAQLTLLARALKDVDFDAPLATKEDLVSYQAQLLHMNLKKEIQSADLQAQNQGIRNLRELIVGVEAKPTFDATDAVTQFIQGVSDPMLKNGLIAYVRDQARLRPNVQSA